MTRPSAFEGCMSHMGDGIESGALEPRKAREIVLADDCGAESPVEFAALRLMRLLVKAYSVSDIFAPVRDSEEWLKFKDTPAGKRMSEKFKGLGAAMKDGLGPVATSDALADRLDLQPSYKGTPILATDEPGEGK